MPREHGTLEKKNPVPSRCQFPPSALHLASAGSNLAHAGSGGFPGLSSSRLRKGMVCCLKSLQLPGRWPEIEFPWPFSSSPCSALLTPCVRAPTRAGPSNLFYRRLRRGGPAQVWSWVWSQTAVCGSGPSCISVASCFIRYFCCPLFSPPSPAIGSPCPSPRFALAKGEGGDHRVFPAFPCHHR